MSGLATLRFGLALAAIEALVFAPAVALRSSKTLRELTLARRIAIDCRYRTQMPQTLGSGSKHLGLTVDPMDLDAGRRQRLALRRGEAVKRGTFCLRRSSEPAVDRFFQLSRCFAAASLAAVPVASSSSSAHMLVVPGCEAAEQLNDGNWQIRSTRTLGPAGEVDAGTIIWRGTVINGVDLGAFLEKRCFRRYKVEPDYPPYIWPPNGYPSWVTPIR